MTSYNDKGAKPDVGKYHGFDYVEFVVSNAKQAADWYCLRFGFEKVAYRGLETKSRDVASHVVKQGKVFFIFSSPLNPTEKTLSHQIAVTGDAAKDVAFTVDDCRGIYKKAVDKGAQSVHEPTEHKDEHGSVVLATVRTYGDVTHTFVERKNYKGAFLPGFTEVKEQDELSKLLPSAGLNFIDHVVGNQPDNEMEKVAKFYEQCFQFHRFWSVDDKQLHTQYSSLRSIVVADYDEVVKMPINEPAPGLKKSQIQEFVDYYGGAGVQHIALNTNDIITAITVLRKRGVSFLRVPKTYYDDLRKRLAKSAVKIQEDLDTIERLNILVDFDDQGYLLQLFTRPVEDRPTLFFEVIQRANHSGFGAGNFKALFESIEREQAERGNL